MTMAAVAAMMAVSAYVGANSLTPSEQLNGIMLENVEALAHDENPCDNINGYRNIPEGKERVYDCCYNEKVGKGEKDCKRW